MNKAIEKEIRSIIDREVAERNRELGARNRELRVLLLAITERFGDSVTGIKLSLEEIELAKSKVDEYAALSSGYRDGHFCLLTHEQIQSLPESYEE